MPDETLRVARCPLPTLTDVEVVFNMMASEAEFEVFAKSLGSKGREAVAPEVRGWPAERYGDDPFGPQAPIAWRIWAVEHGLKQTIKEYVEDPNSLMASTPSTQPTSAGSSSRRHKNIAS